MGLQTEPTNLAKISILPMPTTLGGTQGTKEILLGSFNDVASSQITISESSFPTVSGKVGTIKEAVGIVPFADGQPTLANIQMYTETLVGIFVPSTPAISDALANNIEHALSYLKPYLGNSGERLLAGTKGVEDLPTATQVTPTLSNVRLTAQVKKNNANDSGVTC